MFPFGSEEEIRERCKDPRFCIACFQSRERVEVDEHHVCKDCRQGSVRGSSPRRLPAVTLENGKTYFLDARLRQLRNVHNPHDYIDLEVR